MIDPRLPAPAIRAGLAHPLLARPAERRSPAHWFVDLPLALQDWRELRRIRIATCPWRGCARYTSVFSVAPGGAIGEPIVGWPGGVEDGPVAPWWDDAPWCWMTTSFLAGAPGSNQTYTSPVDWNNANNKIECLGAGGSGGRARLNTFAATLSSTGGGGGAYQAHANLSFATPGTTTATYQVGAGGGGGTTSDPTASGVAGTAGGDTWFDGASYGVATAGAKGGNGGAASAASGSSSGVSGGLSSGGRGNGSGYNGGASGSVTSAGATGGGGSAGPSGAGGASADVTTTMSDGGAGGNGSGGAGGALGSAADGTAGAAGTEWDASHGSGGGGGASGFVEGSTRTAGAGGAYGGGSGACAVTKSSGTPAAITLAGAQGLIVVTTIPKFTGFAGRPVRLMYLRR